MKPSRGMGKVSSQKMPKSVMRKDNKPTKLYAEGGSVIGDALRKMVGMETGAQRKAKIDKAEADALGEAAKKVPPKQEAPPKEIQFSRGGKTRKFR